VEGLKEPGDHTVEWVAKNDNGHNMKSGLYLARIFTGNMNGVARLMLMG
jgi:flagellar hook assembly protein FlgD